MESSSRLEQAWGRPCTRRVASTVPRAVLVNLMQPLAPFVRNVKQYADYFADFFAPEWVQKTGLDDQFQKFTTHETGIGYWEETIRHPSGDPQQDRDFSFEYPSNFVVTKTITLSFRKFAEAASVTRLVTDKRGFVRALHNVLYPRTAEPIHKVLIEAGMEYLTKGGGLDALREELSDALLSGAKFQNPDIAWDDTIHLDVDVHGDSLVVIFSDKVEATVENAEFPDPEEPDEPDFDNLRDEPEPIEEPEPDYKDWV